MALFALFSLLFVLRLALFGETLWPMLLHPVQSMFLGAKYAVPVMERVVPTTVTVAPVRVSWMRRASTAGPIVTGTTAIPFSLAT